jgi:hypothetical protein
MKSKKKKAILNPAWVALGPRADIKLLSKDDFKPINIEPAGFKLKTHVLKSETWQLGPDGLRRIK